MSKNAVDCFRVILALSEQNKCKQILLIINQIVHIILPPTRMRKLVFVSQNNLMERYCIYIFKI